MLFCFLLSSLEIWNDEDIPSQQAVGSIIDLTASCPSMILVASSFLSRLVLYFQALQPRDNHASLSNPNFTIATAAANTKKKKNENKRIKKNQTLTFLTVGKTQGLPSSSL